MQTNESDSAGVRVIEVRPWIDLAPRLVGFELMSLSIGPNGELYALAVTSPADYRETAPSGVIFPKVWTEHPHAVRILRFDGSDLKRLDIPNQHWNFYHVQPLPDDELLLVVSRSRCFSDDAYDLNAKVFSLNGAFKREFLLGDGIRDVQTTMDGRIWIGYSDEGIFGNFGWREPIGKPGLVCWDGFGERTFSYSPPPDFGLYRRMTACYALNVVSDAETWCYYLDMAPRGTFPLISIRDGHIASYWQSPVHGAKGIAIWRNYVLFAGAFRKRDTFFLYQLFDAGRIEHRKNFKVVNEEGATLDANRIAACGSAIVLRHANRVYRIEIAQLAQDA